MGMTECTERSMHYTQTYGPIEIYQLYGCMKISKKKNNIWECVNVTIENVFEFVEILKNVGVVFIFFPIFI